MTEPTVPPAPAPTPTRLMDELARAAAAYYRQFAAMAAESGLTLMQGKTLSLLREPRSMRSLAELLACDASNITGIVDRLESRGLVRREVDPADRRIKNVLLTEEGEQAVHRIRARVMSGLSGLERLSEEERSSLLALLGRVFPEGAL
ncbi:MarR family winged helix-turn-helix transcriptional regulator [Kitasatospora sp. NBC_01266]|uniref:MarR family winged helix-turn-helix transcriptional regulator n=1 Tax=Kitasatospora sp. NBC_01266 TaxID=2903572 RepID=UPI002E30FEB2|nr:MarR family transcriptional regulator [Kitasatospora sp. NBC_01266]